MTRNPNHSRTVSRLGRNLGAVIRAERLLARRQMQQFRRQSALMALGGLVALMGFVMLNIAGFYALKTLMTPYAAALSVAGADFALALLLILIAARPAPEDPVADMRDLAMQELEQDLDAAADELQELSDDLRRLVRDPLGTALPALIGPLITMLVKSGLLRSDKTAPEETANKSDSDPIT